MNFFSRFNSQTSNTEVTPEKDDPDTALKNQYQPLSQSDQIPAAHSNSPLSWLGFTKSESMTEIQPTQNSNLSSLQNSVNHNLPITETDSAPGYSQIARGNRPNTISGNSINSNHSTKSSQHSITIGAGNSHISTLAAAQRSSKENINSSTSPKLSKKNNLHPTRSFENYSSQTADVWDATDLDGQNIAGIEASSGSISIGIGNTSNSTYVKSRPPVLTQPKSSSINRTGAYLSPGQQALQSIKKQRSLGSKVSQNIESSNSSKNSNSIIGGTDHLLAAQTAAKLVIEQAKNTESAISNQQNSISTSSKNDSDQKQNEDKTKRKQSLPPTNLSSKELNRISRFEKLLEKDNLEISELRKAAWSGIPNLYRGDTWRLLCGYMPCSMDRRRAALKRKRNEYNSLIKRYFESSNDPEHSTTFRQIHIDIPRTHPGIELFQKPQVQDMLQRLLFIWAIRHPASGYVQGINDLATPFMIVFIINRLYGGDLNKIPSLGMEGTASELLEEQTQVIVEADTFWCLTKLLDTIQDHFTFAQPGIQRQVHALGFWGD